MKKESIAIVVFAAVVLALWSWLEFSPSGGTLRPSLTSEPPPHGLNTLSLGIDGWRTMNWEDIPQTAAAMGQQAAHRERFLRQSGNGEFPPPVHYLRGLLLLAQDESAPAWESFANIPAQEIPVRFLYAPWRVAMDVAPESSGELTRLLLKGIQSNEIGGLVGARVQAFTGSHEESVMSYLSTDPSDWTGFDLRCFQLLLENEAVAQDAQMIIAGAWRGGRIPEILQSDITTMIVEPARPEAAEIAPKLDELFRENPTLLNDAVQGLASLQEDRRLFLREEFRGLLDRHEAGNLPMIDETLILLVISASAEQDPVSWVRWSQEMRERFPQPEVSEWLQTLAPPNP